MSFLFFLGIDIFRNELLEFFPQTGERGILLMPLAFK